MMAFRPGELLLVIPRPHKLGASPRFWRGWSVPLAGASLAVLRPSLRSVEVLASLFVRELLLLDSRMFLHLVNFNLLAGAVSTALGCTDSKR